MSTEIQNKEEIPEKMGNNEYYLSSSNGVDGLSGYNNTENKHQRAQDHTVNIISEIMKK